MRQLREYAFFQICCSDNAYGLKRVSHHTRVFYAPEEFVTDVDRWMHEYNVGRIKQSLGWKTPMEYRMAALTDVAWPL